MSVDPAERDTRRALDTAALERTLRRMEARPAPWLHTEVARRMADRLPLIRRTPQQVLDWWPGLGGGASHLRAAYPRARVLDVERRGREAAPATTAGQRRWPGLAWPWRRKYGAAAPVLTDDEVPLQAVELVWANMALHWAPDPLAVMLSWRQALQADGFLMFSTLGPGSLASLRRLYEARGWGDPFAAFVDMHDLGDMLVRAGFADPVMDQEMLRLTWSTPPAALAEVRGLGANLSPARVQGLRTPRWHAELLRALSATTGSDGRIVLEFEIVYGHAFNPATVRVEAETRLGLDQMRSMLRSPRTRG